MNGYLNRGDAFQCPVCGGVFRYFLAAGDPGQERTLARCPQCDSLERHRLLWLFLNKETDILRKPVKVLHFAPERCFEDRFQNMKNIEYVTADLDPKLVMKMVDITNIPFADSSFDMVICSHVLEHVPDDLTAMKELKRITRPSGAVIIMVPTAGNKTLDGSFSESPEVRRERYGQPDHVRLYGSDIADRLVAAGFKVDARQYAGELTNSDVERYRLVMKESRFDRLETIFLCKPD
jgi:SAM-dependent methyltransferase